MKCWNPWHGCTKISPGCAHCYMYRSDEKYGRNPKELHKTSSFDLPIKRTRSGEYKLQDPSGTGIFTCGTSDFFHEDADCYRRKAWEFIRERSDLDFLIITKRIHRFYEQLPKDWDDGYENVTIGCTCENQERADFRLPIFIEAPIKHRIIIHEPMLEPIQIEEVLKTGLIDMVLCGGESGDGARICAYDWILDTREQAIKYKVPFYFKQTGARFLMNGKVYQIPRKEQGKQAKKAKLDYPHEHRDGAKVRSRIKENLKEQEFRQETFKFK